MNNVDTARLWCEEHLARNGSLQRDGRTWLCSNPTREDKHPSLSVDIERRVFNDFATSEAGTISQLAALLNVEAPAWEPEAGREEGTSTARAEVKKNASSDAVKLWKSGKPAQPDHPYLSRKKIAPHSCREVQIGGERTLLVPAFDEQGCVVGAERIRPDGSKAHLGQKAGAFHLLGAMSAGRPVAIAEGFSTAAAVHEFSGLPTVCAFGAGNVAVLARRLREKYPDIELVAATDADDAGEKAAAGCPAGTLAVIPNGAIPHLDWCDVAVELGSEEARRQFTQKLESARAKAPKKPSLRSLRSTLAPERGVKPEMIGGIFPRGGVSILAGQQGSGKSLLMQRFCSDVSLGGEILSGVCSYASPRKVVYFVGELPEATMNDRTRTTGWPFNADNFVLYNRIEASKADVSLDLTDIEGFKNIVAIIRDEKPDMVVFDSLMSFNTCDESDMKTMQEVFSKLVRLAGEEKVAVVLIHHIRKRKSVERQCRLHMDDIIGSSIITRNASVAVGAEAMKQDDGAESVYVSNLKSWYAPLDEFAFRIVRDDNKVLRGIEIELDPKSPAANKTEAIKKAVFTGHADGSEFTVAGIATLTGSTEGYVRRLFREWEAKGMIESRGGSKNTSYNIMQKYRNHIQTLANTEKDSGTTVPESTGILISPECDSGTDSGIPVLPVPESFPVIPTAEDSFRYKPMIPGTSKGNLSFLYAEREPEHLFPRDSVFGDVGSGENNAEAPKIEQSSIPRGASAPGPLVEVESFPDDMQLPYEWPGRGWIVGVNRTGNGERSFMIAKSPNGKPVCALREPKRVAP